MREKTPQQQPIMEAKLVAEYERVSLSTLKVERENEELKKVNDELKEKIKEMSEMMKELNVDSVKGTSTSPLQVYELMEADAENEDEKAKYSLVEVKISEYYARCNGGTSPSEMKEYLEYHTSLTQERIKEIVREEFDDWSEDEDEEEDEEDADLCDKCENNKPTEKHYPQGLLTCWENLCSACEEDVKNLCIDCGVWASESSRNNERCRQCEYRNKILIDIELMFE